MLYDATGQQKAEVIEYYYFFVRIRSLLFSIIGR